MCPVGETHSCFSFCINNPGPHAQDSLLESKVPPPLGFSPFIQANKSKRSNYDREG
jgi:hypothetical protein